MKTRIIVLLFFGKMCLSFGQSVTIEPNKTAVKTVGAITELEITNYGGTANLSGRSSQGTASAPLVSEHLDNLFNISAAGYVGGVNPYYSSASIDFQISYIELSGSANANNSDIAFDKPSSNAQLKIKAPPALGTDIVFKNTFSSLLSPAPKMMIRGSGLVGVGTSNPRAKLHIVDGGSSSGYGLDISMIIESSGATTMSLISPENSVSGIFLGDNVNDLAGKNASILNKPDTTLFFSMGNSKMTLSGVTGNVAIGDITAKAKLHIGGDISLENKEQSVGISVITSLNRQNSSVIFFRNYNGAISNSSTVHGIASPSEGLILYIYPTDNCNVTLKHLGDQGLPNEKILTHTGSDITLSSKGGATLLYDESAMKWRVISVIN
jgi:hypothetical protein